MGAFAEYLASQAPSTEAVPAAPVDDSPGQFGTGLRSGLYGGYSQLQSLGGNVAEAAGFPGVADAAYAGAHESQAQAEAAAPRVSSYKDVHDLRSGYDYVTGLVGQSLPQSAVAVGGAALGRTPVGRVVGAAAGMTPFEAGDVVQRQQADPAAMQAPADERLLHAVGGGLASAGAQSILPAMVGGKLAGPVAGAERASVGQVLSKGLREAPLSMGIEAGGNVAGEAAKQQAVALDDPSREMDIEALKEAGVGGLAAGVPLHAAGVAGELAHAAARSPGNALAGVVDKARTALAPKGVENTEPGAPAPASSMPDPVAAVKGIYDKGAAQARDFFDRVANREDVADLSAVAGKTAEQIKAALPGLDNERVQKVAQAAKDLMERAGLDEGRRAQLQAAAADLTDRGNQAVVAGLKKGADATNAFAEKAKALYDEFAPKVKAALSGDAKKSEDFSGVRQAIAQELVPVLQKVNPGIFEDHAALGQAADGVRMAIDAFKGHGTEGLTSSNIARLIDTFGDETVNVLDSVHRAMGKVSPEESERFYSALNEIRAQKGEQDKTLGLMQRSLLPELQDTTKTSEVRSELQALRDAVTRIDTSTAKGKFQWETIKFDLDTRYGKNADKILAAIEKDTRPKENVLGAERVKTDPDTGEVISREDHGLTVVDGKNGTVYYGPEKGGLTTKDSPQAVSAAERARKQHPGYEPEFLTADELGPDHPGVKQQIKELQTQFIAAGKTADEAMRLAKEAVRHYGATAVVKTEAPGTITKDNIKQVQVKHVEDVGRSKYDQPSVFKVDNTSFDAIAITKLMEQQFKGEFSASDDKGQIHRNARMFMEGIGALQDHLGKHFDIPDSLVIDHKGTTVADVKKMGFAPANRGGEILERTLKTLRERYAEAETKSEREAIRQEAQDAVDKAKAFDPRMDIPDVAHEGQPDADPFGNIHAALKGGEMGAAARADFDKARVRGKGEIPGGPRVSDEETAAKSGPVKGTSDVLREKFQAWADKPPSAAAKTVAERAIALLDNKQLLSGPDKKGLAALLSKGTKPSDVAGTVTALWKKYGERLGEKAPAAEAAKPVEAPKVEAAKPEAPKVEALKPHPLDADFAKEHYPEFGTTDEAKAFLLDAYKRWGELRAEDRRVLYDEDHPTNELPATQKKAFYALSNLFESDSHADLGSFISGERELSSASDDEIRAYLKKAAPEVAAMGAPKGKASLEGIGTQAASQQQLQDVRRYVDKVLGPSVKTALAKIPHAGEFVNDTIRVSVHALNPMTVAYHEALHAFFAKLTGQGNGDVAKVLERAAMAAPIQNQLRKLLAGEHAALAQLRDPEEAAAYMYQFWAAGKLQVGGATGNLFTRVKEAIAKVLGVWTNDRRAQAIMDYFHSGEFKTSGMGQPNAVAKALMMAGRNEILEKAKTYTKPLANMADALSTAGGQRLRDTGIPALRELADLMKVTGREATNDQGFVPMARVERTRVMNELGDKLKGYTKEHFDDALKAMQSGGTATTPEGRLVQRAVQGKDGLLPTMLEYMRQAGVDVKKIQPRPDYFPRLYDSHYISRHQVEFQTVLESHGLSQAESRAITLNLMATNGAEFTVETDRPGMQNLKPRALAMIPDAHLERFMRKNMFEILGSYVSQATRRAEWARRFGDDGQGITRLLDQAKQQGATPEQLDTGRKFVRAVDGTLGDTLSPTARRLMGNVIVYQNWRLLPLAIFSSVVDPLGIAVRGGTVRDAWSTFKRGVKEIPSSFRNDFKADGDTELAATLGVIDHAMLADTTGQLYMQGMVGDGVKKMNDALFRFNLMEGFNRSMRVGATQAAIRFLERHQDGKASPHSERWLTELGLQPGFKMDLSDPKVRAAVNMWVDGAVLRPDSVDKPIWMNDPHYMLLSHLKQFVYAFQETILKRVSHEFQQGNYAPAMALSAYVPVMIASDLIKGMIQGAGSLPQWKQDWGPGDYLGSGIERAGLLGKAQFPVDGVGMMMGPTLQQAMSITQALDGKAKGPGLGTQALKALPAETLYSGWLNGGAGGSRVENSMSVD